MAKLENWDVELVKYCSALRRQPLDYIIADCVLIAAGAVEVQTGVDHAAPHRGKYASEGEARAYMVQHGWPDVDAVVDSFLPRIDKRTARRGDIMLFEGVVGKTLGICLGRHSMVMSLEGGGMWRSDKAISAWRVG
jgi:hypothetical protein